MIPRQVRRLLDDHYWTVLFVAVEAVALFVSIRLGGTP